MILIKINIVNIDEEMISNVCLRENYMEDGKEIESAVHIAMDSFFIGPENSGRVKSKSSPLTQRYKPEPKLYPNLRTSSGNISVSPTSLSAMVSSYEQQFLNSIFNQINNKLSAQMNH